MVKNIRLTNPNMVRIGSYFYSINEETDILIQKADDGTLAFAYPLDTPIPQEVTSLEHDGESFWSMENISGTPNAGFRIRRWIINNFVLVLQQTFTFDSDGNDTFESEAFTVEHYEGALTSGAAINATEFSVNYSTAVLDLITPGTTLFLGPSTQGGSLGEFERVIVASRIGSVITITAPLTNGFVSTDPAVFSKSLWFFNQNFQTSSGGALYKAAIADGSILSRTQSGTFEDINACTFHELDSFTSPLTAFNKPYLVFIKATQLMFLNTNDSNLTIELSAVQNNQEQDPPEIYDVSDLGIIEDTIFRLQKKFNINGTITSESTFNYQLATFKPFPTAIAIDADPAVLAADSGASTSTITATVTDQYALAFSDGTIQFGTSGGGTGSSLDDTGQIALDPNGQAVVIYTTGNAAGLVTITATVTIT